MLPTGLLTVKTPSATVHPAGPPPFTFTHSSRFLPSNRTMASDGASAAVAPGETTRGSGSQTSVSFGLGLGVVVACGCCAASGATSSVAHRHAEGRKIRVVMAVWRI